MLRESSLSADITTSKITRHNYIIQSNEYSITGKTRLGPRAHMKLYKLGKSRFNRREYKSRIYSAQKFKRGTKLLAECKNGYEMYDEVTKDYSDKTSLNIEVNNGRIHPPLQICKEGKLVLVHIKCLCLI